MQKLSIANPKSDAGWSARDIAPLVGMAALWISAFKQLLYPSLFAYRHTGDESALMAQSIYSVALVVSAFVLLVSHAHLERFLTERRGVAIALVIATGIAGSIGIALRAFFPSVSADAAAVYVGSALSAIYLPIHFAFWAFSIRLTHEPREAIRSIAFSFLLFVVAYLLLTVTGTNTAWVSIACPIVSALMALACPYGDTADREQAHGETGKAKPDAAIADATGIPSAAPLPPATPALPPATPALAPNATESASLHDVLLPDSLPNGFADAFNLSEREAELAAYARRNYSARKIASELFIAESTVYTHLKRIYRKTDVHSKHELIELIDSWEADSL